MKEPLLNVNEDKPHDSVESQYINDVKHKMTTIRKQWCVADVCLPFGIIFTLLLIVTVIALLLLRESYINDDSVLNITLLHGKITYCSLITSIPFAVLLLINVTAFSVTKLSKYYFPSNKSYIITSFAEALLYFGALFDTYISTMLLVGFWMPYFFEGRHFYSISWAFSTKYKRCCFILDYLYKIIPILLLIANVIFEILYWEYLLPSDFTVINVLLVLSPVILIAALFGIIFVLTYYEYIQSLSTLLGAKSVIYAHDDEIFEKRIKILQSKRISTVIIFIFMIVISIEYITWFLFLFVDVWSSQGVDYGYLLNDDIYQSISFCILMTLLSIFSLSSYFTLGKYLTYWHCKYCNVPIRNSCDVCDVCGANQNGISMKISDHEPPLNDDKKEEILIELQQTRVRCSRNSSYEYIEKDENKDENKYDSDANFEFGSFINYSLLKSKYSSFKEERIYNTMHQIDISVWDNIYHEAQNKLNQDEARQLIAKNNLYNISKIQKISIGNVMAIKLYTDLDIAQSYFRKSFRKQHKYDTDKDIIKRHCDNYYFWGKNLNHAITIYGTKLNENKTYYHGLNHYFMFPSLIKDFNIPTSFTTSLIVASSHRFAGNNGIILQVKALWPMESKWNRIKSLNVEWISCHPQENETLLFGNFNQLMIYNVIIPKQSEQQTLRSQKISLICFFERICDGYVIKSLGDPKKKMNFSELKILIQNEINNSFNNDYVSMLFHNICRNRTLFTIKYMVTFRNIIDMFQNIHSQTENIGITMQCDGCDIDMTCVNETEYGSCFYCHSQLIKSVCQNCQYSLCIDCLSVLIILQRIFTNARHLRFKMSEYNEIKTNALQIELLQSKTLF
eukprot:148603_1